MAFALRFTGRWTPPRSAEALNDVVARHEALRTNFVEHEGVPYQIVHPTVEVELRFAGSPTDRLEETVAELRRYVFTLESDR